MDPGPDVCQFQGIVVVWIFGTVDCCVCAPSDDYVIGCLLTRRGSKMLDTHQMVDCVNCMFGYCVLIGCLATEGGRQ